MGNGEGPGNEEERSRRLEAEISLQLPFIVRII